MCEKAMRRLRDLPVKKKNNILLRSLAEQRDEVREALEINIGRTRGAVMHAEAVVDGGSKCSGVARGLHVHIGIADEQGLNGGRAEFAQDSQRAQRVGLFRLKTVAAI